MILKAIFQLNWGQQYLIQNKAGAINSLIFFNKFFFFIIAYLMVIELLLAASLISSFDSRAALSHLQLPREKERGPGSFLVTVCVRLIIHYEKFRYRYLKNLSICSMHCSTTRAMNNLMLTQFNGYNRRCGLQLKHCTREFFFFSLLVFSLKGPFDKMPNWIRTF